jgi:hypothetical protein
MFDGLHRRAPNAWHGATSGLSSPDDPTTASPPSTASPCALWDKCAAGSAIETTCLCGSAAHTNSERPTAAMPHRVRRPPIPSLHLRRPGGLGTNEPRDARSSMKAVEPAQLLVTSAWKRTSGSSLSVRIYRLARPRSYGRCKTLLLRRHAFGCTERNDDDPVAALTASRLGPDATSRFTRAPGSLRWMASRNLNRSDRLCRDTRSERHLLLIIRSAIRHIEGVDRSLFKGRSSPSRVVRRD